MGNGKKAVVIGAGLAGLGTAALLGRDGFEVTVVEKNSGPGGRASVFEDRGFLFDKGPSWVLMPEAFERFFGLFGRHPSDDYDLVRLDPSYRIHTGPGEHLDVAADLETNLVLFEKIEPGAGAKVRSYLEAAAKQYRVSVDRFLYRTYDSLGDMLDPALWSQARKLRVLGNVDGWVSSHVRDRRLKQILEYTMVFIGGSPKMTPAFYALMSHIDLGLGVWYPMGGIGRIPRALETLALENGVRFAYGQPAVSIATRNGRAVAVETKDGSFEADVVVSNADYHHTETRLLEPRDRTYTDRYWSRRTVSPSGFIIYLGLSRKLAGLAHHNLFFEEDWDRHFDTVFRKPGWPEHFSYYISCPSRTDPAVAPADGENLFFLVPVAPGLPDGDDVREAFAGRVLDHFEALIGQRIRDAIVVRRIYSHRDFIGDYNAFQGSAFGLAHTLFQTAVFRPAGRSRKISNLHFAGQYPHPGVGMPMTLICAEITAGRIARESG